MHSIRTLIPLVGFSFAFFQVAVANPIPDAAIAAKPKCTSSHTSTAATTPTSVIHVVATPALPVNGGPTELPAAAPSLKLLHVAVGKGTQNYTCSAVGAVPVSDGAVATLYDTTSLAFSDVALLHKAPPLCVNVPASAVPKGAISIPGLGSFPILGVHYFTNTAPIVPTFDLSSAKQLLSGTKLMAIPAPAGAATGPAGTGAVPWLQLGNSGLSVGATAGYRVVTAGGNAPATCSSTGIISVQYCAEYWFYG